MEFPIVYYKINSGTSLNELILDNYPRFRQWYLATDKESLDESGKHPGHEAVRTYLLQAPDLRSSFGHLDKQLIDELTSELIGYYCDFGYGKHLLTLIGPMMNTWRYDETTKKVLATQDPDFIRFWKFLTEERSLKDDQIFESYTKEYPTGFFMAGQTHYRTRDYLRNILSSRRELSRARSARVVKVPFGMTKKSARQVSVGGQMSVFNRSH